MKKFLAGLMMLLSFGVMAQSKIGFVDTQSLLDTMPSRKAAEVKYLAFEEEQYMELQSMQQEGEKMYKEYEAKKGDMTPVIRQSWENKLMEKEQQIQKFAQTMQQTLQAYTSELNQPILDRVQEAVKIVATRKKLDLVVDQTTTLYFNETLDITAEVAAELLKLDKAAMAASPN